MRNSRHQDASVRERQADIVSANQPTTDTEFGVAFEGYLGNRLLIKCDNRQPSPVKGYVPSKKVSHRRMREGHTKGLHLAHIRKVALARCVNIK